MNPTDARIVLTGAAGGIGSAIARRLAASGATLLLTDLRQEPLDRLAAELGAAAHRTLAADIATDEGRATLVTAAREHRANVLINAAGINPFGLFTEQTAPDIGRAFAINALAPMHVVPRPAARASGPHPRAYRQRRLDVWLDRLSGIRGVLGEQVRGTRLLGSTATRARRYRHPHSLRRTARDEHGARHRSGARA